MHYDVGGCVIDISNKVEYLDKEKSFLLRLFYFSKNSTEEACYIVIQTYPCNAIKKMLDKMSFHKHFNLIRNWEGVLP